MRTVILAAGQSTRMADLTTGGPKCLLRIQGQTLLEHNVRTLAKLGITDIVLVRGRNHDLQADRSIAIDGAPAGNMVSSLMLAKEYFDRDLVIMYADVLYSLETLRRVSQSVGDFVVPVDVSWKRVFEHRVGNVYSEAESCMYDAQLYLRDIGRVPATPANAQAQFMGLIRCSPDGLRIVADMWEGKDKDAPLPRGTSSTELLQLLIDSGHGVRALPMQGGWFEFDTPVDYVRALELTDDPDFSFLGPVS